MTEPHTMPGVAAPSSRALLRSTIIAAVTAAILLVTVVLPAEYGFDPTRIGGILGLTEMGRIKMALAQEAGSAHAGATAAAPEDVTAAGAEDASGKTPPRSDQTTITLRPDEGREVKLIM